MTPLRHIARTTRNQPPEPTLYPPQTPHRIRRDNTPDTPLPPEIPAARNPPDGAIIDYYLAADAAQPIALEVFTAAGKLVRRWASDDTPEPFDEKQVNVPTYWIRPRQILSGTKGMHRFVWDLRYPMPGAVQYDYPISAIDHDTPREPLGVIALPGAYTVRLTVGGQTFTERLTLKMDPRASITPIGLARQFKLATKVADMMNRSFAAIHGAQSPVPGRQSDLASLNGDLATAYHLITRTHPPPTP